MICVNRIDADELLKAIIGEAEVALRTKNFEEQVRKMHLIVHTLEQRIRRFEDMWHWSEMERLCRRLDEER